MKKILLQFNKIMRNKQGLTQNFERVEILAWLLNSYFGVCFITSNVNNFSNTK